mmetsp:Transcript_91087/g.150945  ORF Transcript_91087/g.150945 Transcript_91087/m.150945 type:complete len:129 (-) Transcript_91087:1000-1386(-)
MCACRCVHVDVCTSQYGRSLSLYFGLTYWQARKAVLRALLDPQMSMAPDSFCIRLSSRSPCLMISTYTWLRLSDVFDSITPPTLSILQVNFPEEMNDESSVSMKEDDTPNSVAMASSVTDRYEARNCL